MLVKTELCVEYDICELDSETEGILWIRFTSKSNSENVFSLCVCYLPPENSSRHVCVNEFYEALLSKVYMYQELGPCYINGRIGLEQDLIEGVDEVQERIPTDTVKNAYGEKLLDFLISASCCIVNGRSPACTKDDFTYVSNRGKSVVDYCIVPHEALTLQHISDFAVIPAHTRIQECMDVSSIDLLSKIPDHSLLTWTINLSTGNRNSNLEHEPITEEKTVYKREVPADFMSNAEAVAQINENVELLSTRQQSQTAIDELYQKMCGAVRGEMDRC